MSSSADSRADCWIITDGAAGNLRQARALAGAMRVPAIELTVRLRGPWRAFAPRFVKAMRLGVARNIRWHLAPPWPALAIGCGRQAASLTRALRAMSGGKTFTVQILDPRIDPALFDVVVAPRHDGLEGVNVIRTLGALNPVDEQWLAQGLAAFPLLDQLPKPRTALLIGGQRRGLELSDAWFDAFLRRVSALVTRGSLLIACSRRTPDAWRARLRGLVSNGAAHIWTGPTDGENPYQGYLAAADRIVVTPDSVNMISEACATGKPVFTSLPAEVTGRIAAFHAELRDQGWLNTLSEHVDFSTLQQPRPLRELGIVAGDVWHRIEATRPDVAVALARD